MNYQAGDFVILTTNLDVYNCWNKPFYIVENYAKVFDPALNTSYTPSLQTSDKIEQLCINDFDGKNWWTIVIDEDNNDRWLAPYFNPETFRFEITPETGLP